MLYCVIAEDSNDAIKSVYSNVFDIVKMIREHKEDLIYKSAIPRLKQTKLRGIQAFKEVIKKLSDEDKIKYDESIKVCWLKCFKMVYNYNCHALNINGRDCITFDKPLTFNEANEFIGIDDFELSEKEPGLLTHDDAFVDGIYQYILDEGLSDKDLVKLINKLFNELC